MTKAQTVRSRARSTHRTVVADDAPVDPALPQKKRARHRLIGAIVLCVGAAILVPSLLEPEPSRPLSDLSVVIPPKTTNLPARNTEPRADLRPEAARRDSKAPESSASDKPPELPKPETPKAAESRATETRSAENALLEASPAGSALQGSVLAGSVLAGSVLGDADRSKPAAPASSAASSSAQRNASTQPSASTSVGEVTKPAPVIATDSGKQSAPKPGGKYLIQVGAFSSDSAASAALERIQGAGLRGFTEKIKTDRGERIRVRAGPFSTRDAAEQAREKLKATGLEAALIAPS